MHKLLGLATFLLGSLALGAQVKGFEINGLVKDFTGDTVILAYQHEDKMYIQDTFFAKGGKFTMKGDEELPGGIYALVLRPGDKSFQLLISRDEQRFSFECSGPDYASTLKFKGSPDNSLFYEYITFLGEMTKKAGPLRTAQDECKDKTETPACKDAKDKLANMDKEVKAYQQNLVTKHAKTLTAAIVRGNMGLDFPPTPAGMSKEEEREFQFRFYKEHYFDGFDFSDDRLIRTDFIGKKIMPYIENLTVVHPDSMALAADFLIESSRKNKDMYRYVVSKLLYHFETSKFICLDDVFVHISDKWVCNPNAPFGGGFWLKEDAKKKICDKAAAQRHLKCNGLAPNLILQPLDGKSAPVELYKVKAEFTLVYFWDPDCGNCKKQSEKLAQIYDKLKEKGVEVYGICNKYMDEVDKCQKKVEEMQLKWINTADKYAQARAKQLYDIQMTPFMYMLDKDKKILFKKIAADQVEEIVDKELERRAQERDKKSVKKP